MWRWNAHPLAFVGHSCGVASEPSGTVSRCRTAPRLSSWGVYVGVRKLRCSSDDASVRKNEAQEPEVSSERSIVFVTFDKADCPEEVWRKLFIPQSKWQLIGREFAEYEEHIHEAIVMSTEEKVLILVNSMGPSQAVVREIFQYLRRTGYDSVYIRRFAKVYVDEVAAREILRFACGFNGKGGGSDQTDPLYVLMKSNEMSADPEWGSGGSMITNFVESTIRIARGIRKETGLNTYPSNVPAAVVECVDKLCSGVVGLSLRDAKVTFFGEGRESTAVMQQLLDRGVYQVNVVRNDSDENLSERKQMYEAAPPQANFGLYPSSMMFDMLALSDIVFFVGRTGLKLSKSDLQKTLFGVKKIVLVDLSNPPSLAADVPDAQGVTIIKLADVQGLLRTSQPKQADLLILAETLVEDRAQQFRRWFDNDYDRVLNRLRLKAAMLVSEQFSKAKPKLTALSTIEMQLIEDMCGNIMERLLLGPVKETREYGSEEEKLLMFSNLLEIFKWKDELGGDSLN